MADIRTTHTAAADLGAQPVSKSNRTQRKAKVVAERQRRGYKHTLEHSHFLNLRAKLMQQSGHKHTLSDSLDRKIRSRHRHQETGLSLSQKHTHILNSSDLTDSLTSRLCGCCRQPQWTSYFCWRTQAEGEVPAAAASRWSCAPSGRRRGAPG